MKKLLITIAASALLTVPAYAETAIVDFAGGSTFGSFSTEAAGETVGWIFTANDNLSVTDLGWFSPSGNDLLSDHQVGLWTSAGTLLGSVTVTSGAVDGTGYRYSALTPFTLTSGQDYFIGGLITTSDGDEYVTGATSVNTSGLISFVGTARSDNGTGFGFPGIDGLGNGRFGPNFQFTAMGAVPEPATWAFMIFGFGAIGAGLRRQRKAKVHVSYA